MRRLARAMFGVLLVVIFGYLDSARVRVSTVLSDTTPNDRVVPYRDSTSLVLRENKSATTIPGCTADYEGRWDRGCHPMDAEAYARGERCCGRLTSSGRALQGKARYFTIYRKQFKECHDRGLRPYPDVADLDCCQHLEDHETRKMEDSEMCLSNGYSCSRFGAVKKTGEPGHLTCMCPSGTACRQTVSTKYPQAEEFSTCHSTGEFRIHEQTWYNLQCVDEDSASCGALGGIEGRRGCYCGEDKVRVGKPWHINGKRHILDISKAFIRGIGGLKRWQKRELLTLGFAHEVGCVAMFCEDLNAVVDETEGAMSCRCPAARFSSPRGRLPQHPSKSAESSGPFTLQAAWDNGYFCSIKSETVPRCKDGYEDKARDAEAIGMVDRHAQEPWCSCIDEFCEGSHCRQDRFGDWWYPYFCKSCGCTSTPPTSDERVVVFTGRNATSSRSHKPAPAKAEAKLKIRSLERDLDGLEVLERKKLLRRLQLQYHPDKVDEDMLEYSTEVFHFVQRLWDREFK